MHDYDDHFAAPWPPAREQLSALREDICMDAYDESEQIMAFSNAFDEWAQLPVCLVLPAGATSFVAVEDRDRTLAARIQLTSGPHLSVPLEDVRPSDASPAAFLVAAYRLWLGLPPVLPAPNPWIEEGAPDGWEEAKDHLLALPPDRLVDLVGNLYAASHANRASVHRLLSQPDLEGE